MDITVCQSGYSTMNYKMQQKDSNLTCKLNTSQFKTTLKVPCYKRPVLAGTHQEIIRVVHIVISHCRFCSHLKTVQEGLE